MTATTLSVATLSDIIAARDAIVAAYDRGDIDADTARAQLASWLIEQIGPWAGTGADADFAASLGPDYICTLTDGRALAWGGDVTTTIPGYVGRELVIYSAPGAYAAA